MGMTEWWTEPAHDSPRRIRVRMRCEYPDGQPPSAVEFEPDPCLERTPAEVHAAISTLLTRGGDFESPAVSELLPLPFASETVRPVVVR